MDKKTLIPLLAGLGMALLALKFGYDYLSRIKKLPGPEVSVRKIVVAARDLPESYLIGPKDVLLMEVPDTVIAPEFLTDPVQAVGKSLKVAVARKMPVMPRMLSDTPWFAALIPKGFLAIAIRVDEFSGVEGFLSPGDKVAVLGTFTLRQGDRTETLTKILLHNIPVRAVGQQYVAETGDRNLLLYPVRSVTLLVTLEQAQRLQLAMTSGKVHLAMETPVSVGLVEPREITLTELLGKKGPTLDSSKELPFALGKEGKSSLKEGTTGPAPYVVELFTPTMVERLYFVSSTSDQQVAPPAKDLDTSRTEGGPVR
jgi:pilus assembly protein CpaB